MCTCGVFQQAAADMERTETYYDRRRSNPSDVQRFVRGFGCACQAAGRHVLGLWAATWACTSNLACVCGREPCCRLHLMPDKHSDLHRSTPQRAGAARCCQQSRNTYRVDSTCRGTSQMERQWRFDIHRQTPERLPAAAGLVRLQPVPAAPSTTAARRHQEPQTQPPWLQYYTRWVRPPLRHDSFGHGGQPHAARLNSGLSCWCNPTLAALPRGRVVACRWVGGWGGGGMRRRCNRGC